MEMESRWLSLWKRIGGKGSGLDVYKDLIERYSENHRSYHILRHIEECLLELDQVRHLLENPDAVELALWFHDAVYDTKAKDNEERSADLAAEVIKSTSLSAATSVLVKTLILSTKHTSTSVHKDTAFLIDIDLSILGQPIERFDEYETQIRNEYSWVSSIKFAIGRSKILGSLLGRPQIYSTDFFSEKYEARARNNINRSLNQWSYPVRLIISLINRIVK